MLNKKIKKRRQELELSRALKFHLSFYMTLNTKIFITWLTSYRKVREVGGTLNCCV
jgi:hypothetical protein